MKVRFRNDRYNYLSGLQFAMVDKKTNTQLNAPHNCKEVFANNYYHPYNREGKRFRFVLLLTGSESLFDAEKTQDFLNQVEADMGFAKSRVWNVTKDAPEGTQALLVDSSTRWAKNSPLIHLLLLLVRNGSLHDPKKNWKNTLSKFRRTVPFQPVDQAQFLVLKDTVPFVVSRKGNLPALRMNLLHQPELSHAPGEWMKQFGICTWAEKMKEIGVIK